MSESIQTQDIKTFRFKFSQNFMPFLVDFSEIHRYDDPKAFKDHWDIWIKDNKEVINREINILRSVGYDGDVLVKMYKSARYYFKNKSTEKTNPKKRRQYIGLERDFLDSIDSHINDIALKNSMKPAKALINFLDAENNKEIIKKEIQRLKKFNLDITEINQKFKKTYKNRYFNKCKQN